MMKRQIFFKTNEVCAKTTYICEHNSNQLGGSAIRKVTLEAREERS